MQFGDLYFQLEERFDNAPFANEDVNGTVFEFDEWADAAENDGWLCRDAADCTWIDDKMECSSLNDNSAVAITVRIDSKFCIYEKVCAATNHWRYHCHPNNFSVLYLFDEGKLAGRLST